MRLNDSLEEEKGRQVDMMAILSHEERLIQDRSDGVYPCKVRIDKVIAEWLWWQHQGPFPNQNFDSDSVQLFKPVAYRDTFGCSRMP